MSPETPHTIAAVPPPEKRTYHVPHPVPVVITGHGNIPGRPPLHGRRHRSLRHSHVPRPVRRTPHREIRPAVPPVLPRNCNVAESAPLHRGLTRPLRRKHIPGPTERAKNCEVRARVARVVARNRNVARGSPLHGKIPAAIGLPDVPGPEGPRPRPKHGLVRHTVPIEIHDRTTRKKTADLPAWKLRRVDVQVC